MKIFALLVFPITCFISCAFAAEPSLYIKEGANVSVYTRSELLHRPDVTTITTSSDPVFPKKTITYTAIPAAPLFKKIVFPAGATIHFHALDGFSAPIIKEQLMNTHPDAAVAYIAIEKADEKWPAVKPGVDDRTSAPFYLIWKNPEKSHISTELWVMQLAGFTIDAPFESLYPNVSPAKTLAADDPVMLGFKTFKANCFSCHTINREGNSKIGPDLNVPYNPTEYFHDEYLRKFIRNPQSLRHWPQDRMNAFPETIITDAELDDLIAYLRHMKGRKN